MWFSSGQIILNIASFKVMTCLLISLVYSHPLLLILVFQIVYTFILVLMPRIPVVLSSAYFDSFQLWSLCMDFTFKIYLNLNLLIRSHYFEQVNDFVLWNIILM